MDRTVAFLAVEHNDTRVPVRSPAECVRRFAKAKQVLPDRVPATRILMVVDRDLSSGAGFMPGVDGGEIV